MSAAIIQSNNAVSAQGVPAGCTIQLGQYQAFPLQTLQVEVASGVIATLSVQLEVSLNGTDYRVLGSPITNIAGGILAPQIQYPFPYVRANVTVLTGTTPVIKVIVGVGRFFQG